MNVVEALQNKGIRIKTEGHEHCRLGWVQLDCPYCSPDTGRFRLGIDIKSLRCNCWACGPHPVFQVLSLLQVPTKGLELARTRRKERPPGKLILPKGVEEMSRRHRRYLSERGFDPDEISERWGVRGIGLCSRLKWRLFIPIHRDSEVVSWTTRSLSNSHDRRYVSASPSEEAVPHKSLLYGEQLCGHAIIICEGPTDVWRIGPGAVCTFGTSFTTAQVNRMVEHPTRVICYDNEAAAQRQARRLMDTLCGFRGATINVMLTEAKDPGSASRKTIKRLRSMLL